MLYHLPVLSTLQSPGDIEKYFGTPETFEIRLRKDRSPLFDPPHIPRYIVFPACHSLLFEQIFANPSLAELKICDFGESSLLDPPSTSTKRHLNCPNVYAAPEVIFDNVASFATDIWALGNTIHHIMDGGSDGETAIQARLGCSRDEVLCSMVLTLGSKLPERWWNIWEKRKDYFDEEGEWVGGKRPYGPSALGPRMFPPGSFLGGRWEAFVEILRRTFAYEPMERLTAPELVKELRCLLEGGST
jgi:serine/threonine-protein kinase SRPK3